MTTATSLGRASESVDTVIVGNGPAGLCLSAFLSGHHPRYLGGHPDGALDGALMPYRGKSLVECLPTDILDRVPCLMDGRGALPLARLFDAIHHPEADRGRSGRTCIDTVFRAHHAVAHVVLGREDPGGSWHRMPPRMDTLSPGAWLELPGLSLVSWGRGQGRWIDPGARLDRNATAAYYRDYPTRMGIHTHLQPATTVTRVEPVDGGWRVAGERADHQPFVYTCRRVVLATGMYDRPRALGIPGEEHAAVSHRGSADGSDGPLLVVGAGLSAADVILAALAVGRTVIHVFRGRAAGGTLERLDGRIYPEYDRLRRAMAGESLGGYTAFAESRLLAIAPDGRCRVHTPRGSVVERVKEVAVRIGSDPDLGFLQGVTGVPGPENDEFGLAVDPVTFATGVPGLYAIGPLAGDNFVRFITGHALGVAAHIRAQYRRAEHDDNSTPDGEESQV